MSFKFFHGLLHKLSLKMLFLIVYDRSNYTYICHHLTLVLSDRQCLLWQHHFPLQGVNFTSIYEQIFHFGSVFWSFSLIKIKNFNFFWWKNIGKKAACRMMVKLSIGWKLWSKHCSQSGPMVCHWDSNSFSK